MNLYKFAKPFLFQLDAENAHDLTLKSLRFAEKTGVLSLLPKPAQCEPKEVMGLTFPNPVGLAADSNFFINCSASFVDCFLFPVVVIFVLLS